eukprot:3598257-Amphidinium_carterae.1
MSQLASISLGTSRVLRILCSGLHLQPGGTISAFNFMPFQICDSDWAGCPISRKSTTGVVCQLWGASIVHYSRTQATVAQSSAEAE